MTYQRLLLVILCCLFSTQLLAAQCSGFFTNGAQTNDASGNVKFEWNAKIDNASSVNINTNNVLQNSADPVLSCDSGDCVASGTIAATANVLNSFSGTTDVFLNAASRTLTPGDYNIIQVTGNSARLTLSAGDYYLKGDLRLFNNSRLIISGGTVRIFVNGIVNIQNNVNTNGSASDLLIFSRNNIELASTSSTNAFLYSEAEIIVHSSLTGAANAKNVTLQSSATINFDSTPVDFGDFCGATATPATLMLHYKFNEGVGQLVSDTSVNNRNANLGFNNTQESNDAEWACNVAGSHLNFTGSLLQRATGPNFSPPEEGTVAFWLKVPATPTQRQRVFGFHDGFELRWEGTGVMHWDINKTGTNNTMVSNGAVTDVNTWIHLAFTTNVNTNDWAFYLNGVLNNSGNFGQSAQPANTLTLGTRTGDASYFTGSLDDFRLYNGELSASQIAGLAATPPVDRNCSVDFDFCNTTFVDGLTSHSNSGVIEFNNRVTIFDNPDNILAASRLNPTTHQAGGRSLTCDGFGFCSASGTPAQPINSVGSFLSTNSSTNFTVRNNRRTCTIGEAANDDCADQTGNEYNVVRVNNDGTLFFSANHTEYRIQQLIVNDRAVIYLSPGDYWIEQLDFNNDTQLIIQGSGRVNLYINNSLNRFADRAKVNISGDAENLFLYSFNDLRINNDIDFKGFIYSAQTLTLGARLNLTGAASAANLSVGDDSEVYYTCSLVAPVAIDHYQIVHDATGLTCEAETVTIKACTNADTATCTEYTSPTTVDLFVDGPTNDVAQTGITFTGNTTVNFQYTLAEAVTLSLNNTSVAANNNLSCISAGVDSGCAMAFRETGFRFFSENETSIPNQISGKPSNIGFNNQRIYIQAVEKNTTTGACQGVALDDSIAFAAQCTNPNTCSGLSRDRLSVNNVAVPTTNTLPSSYQAIDVGFDNSDTAEIILNYPEAGELTLSARYNIPVNGVPSGNFMLGEDAFVVRPFGFHVEVTGNPAATDHNGGAFVAAGVDFPVTITAKAWEAGDDTDNDGIPNTGADLSNNTTTQNFTNHHVQIIHNLVATDGNIKPALSNNIFSNFSAGKKTQAISWGEVGILSFDVDLAVGDYLGAGNIQGHVPYVGRFYPAKFLLESPMVSPACDNIFTYMGDPNLDIAYEIHALNANNQITKNYIGNFVKSTVTFVAENNNDAVNRGDRLPAITQNWGVGNNAGKLINPIASLVAFQRESEPDGPFESLNIGLKLVDVDGASLQSLNLRANTIGTCTNTGNVATDCDAISLGTTSVRYGRLVLPNAYGPETSNLLMPMQVEYLNAAGQYVVNTDDSCTMLDINNGEVTFNVNNFTSLEPTAATSAEATSGKINLIELVAPNTRGNVTVTMQAPTWLTFDWNDDNTLESPSALATFGLFRGNDRIIQWREITLE